METSVPGAFFLHFAASALLGNLYWIPTALVDICMVASTSISYAARYVFVDRQKHLIQRAFNNYLSDMLVQKIVDTGEDPVLGGENRDITVMFADLRGFTTMSENIASEKLVTLMNTYLQIIGEEVNRTGGYIDKFIGDTIMAMWGAPVSSPNHALKAVRAGMHAARRINDKHRHAHRNGESGFDVNIGINTGSAIVGNVGAKGRLNYTAVGKAVNIAARLESIPSDYGCSLVIGEEPAAQVASSILLNEIDRVRFRGKNKPTSIFQPICDLEKAGETEKLFCQKYAEALRQFRGGNFLKAAELWEIVYRETSELTLEEDVFSAAKVMLERAKNLCRNPPPETWDGVWMRTKK